MLYLSEKNPGSDLEFACSNKVEIFLEQRKVAFLSPIKICKHLNFSTVNL